MTGSWRGWKVEDVSEARVNNAFPSGQPHGVRWEIRSAGSASEMRPGPQNNFCRGLAPKGLKRRAGAEKSDHRQTPGSGLRTQRAGPGLRPGGRRSPALPTLGRCSSPAPMLGLYAETEAGGRPAGGREPGAGPRRASPSHTHAAIKAEKALREGRGGAGRDPNKPTCGPARRGDVTARWRARPPYPCRGP